MNLQWYPGHMVKTKNLIADNLKLVDAVIEILDARIPYSSKNPELNGILKDKKRLVILNKCSLADNEASKKWLKYYQSQGAACLCVDCKTGLGVSQIIPGVKKLLSDKIEKDREKGMKRSIKLMAVGIPNVGKSTFINTISKKASAKTGDKPGVTRDKQWIRLLDGVELLDTPGILWPKFESEDVGRKLAFTGAIKDEIMDIETLAYFLIAELKKSYLSLLEEKYDVSLNQDMEPDEIIEAIARRRGAIRSGNQIDVMRISAIILDEFRSSKIGNISLEIPGE